MSIFAVARRLRVPSSFLAVTSVLVATACFAQVNKCVGSDGRIECRDGTSTSSANATPLAVPTDATATTKKIDTAKARVAEITKALLKDDIPIAAGWIAFALNSSGHKANFFARKP